MGECLDDEPEQLDYIYPELPAGIIIIILMICIKLGQFFINLSLTGALYDSSRQCRLQFGEGVETVCSEQNEICQRLWCIVNGTCVTMLKPAATGTTCGEDMVNFIFVIEQLVCDKNIFMVHSKFSSGVKIVNVFHALHYHYLKTEVGESGANGQNAHVHVVPVYLSLQDNVIIQCLDLMGNFVLERELGIIKFLIFARLKNDSLA